MITEEQENKTVTLLTWFCGLVCVAVVIITVIVAPWFTILMGVIMFMVWIFLRSGRESIPLPEIKDTYLNEDDDVK